MNRLKQIWHNEIQFILINYIIGNIPLWGLRKLFYRLFGMRIGAGSRIAMKCIILGPHNIVIGENNVINEFALLDGRSGLCIGNNNSISMYAKLYSGTHNSYSIEFEYVGKKCVIGDNTWIGTNAIIMPGSIIEDFSIIGANSLYKGNTIAGGIYQGVPATLIKNRELENKYIIKNQNLFR